MRQKRTKHLTSHFPAKPNSESWKSSKEKQFRTSYSYSYKINTHSYSYTPSAEEAGWLASDQDFQSDNLKGTYIFVGLQAVAAAALVGYGYAADDPGSIMTGAANVVRNGLWMGAHMAVKHVPNLRVCFHTAAAKGLETAYQTLEATDFVKQHTEKARKSLRKSRRSILHKAHEIREPLKDKYNSQLHRDRIHARINWAGAWGGALVHLPQIFVSPDILVKIGAGAAALGYGIMGRDQGIESKKWAELYDKAKDKHVKYDHKDAHMLVGYSMAGEYGKDAFYKWAPPVLLTGKGGSYFAEAWLLASHGSPLTAIATLGASGLLFTGSAINEFKEHNGSKVSYLARKAKGELHNKFIAPLQEWRDRRNAPSYDDLRIFPDRATPAND